MAVELPDWRDEAAEGDRRVACLAVNDVMALAAWARENGTTGKTSMVSDGLCEFTHAVGLEQYVSERGLDMCSIWYAMLIENGKVSEIHLEPPGACEVSKGETVLQRIAS